jgi:cytochrome P450
LGRQIDRIREAKGDPSGKRTIFHSLLNGSLPDSEKKTERLQEEAYIIVIAGTDTTAATLSALTYHLLSNPNVLKKLRDELETAMPDPNESPTLKVETLPYLVSERVLITDFG